MAAVRLSVRTLFPSPCGQPVGGSPGACVSQPLRAALAGAAGRQRRAVAGSRGSRPSGVPGIPGRAAGSGPVCTALRRQGRAVARAKSPRHRRLRLRHEIHRRGNASAASRPSQARARVAETVCQSASPLDCPRARLGCQAMFWPPVGSATRSNRRCALPHLIAPNTPSRGFADRLPLLEVSGRAAPAIPGAALRAVLSFLSTRTSACHGEMGRSACTYPSAVFPPSSGDFAMYCSRASASRPGLSARTRVAL